jgi:hypothetical protein
VALKSGTDELTQANVAYNEMKQQFLFEVERLRQGMEQVSAELE